MYFGPGVRNPTLDAIGIVVILASLADARLSAAHVVLFPDPHSVVATKERSLVQTARTELQSVKWYDLHQDRELRIDRRFFLLSYQLPP